MSSSYVKTLHKNNWKDALRAAEGAKKLLVMQFVASWSEPSKLMNPIVANTIAPRFSGKVDFCMLDTDEFKDLARALEVEALPTFLLVKDCYEMDRVVGVDKDKLELRIRAQLNE
ncbi:unnamed protein product [Urochloa humidicola]